MTDQELIAEIKKHFATKDVRVENMGINKDETCNILITVFNVRMHKNIIDKRKRIIDEMYQQKKLTTEEYKYLLGEN